MINGKSVTAIILVAGNSTRFGKNTNKNLEIIKGKPVLVYSLEKFSNNEYVDDIIVTVKEQDMENIKKIIKKTNMKKKVKLVIRWIYKTKISI